MQTLNERLRAAMNGPPKITQAQLAKACGVRQPSVNAWLSGRTRGLDGQNLISAARFLRVNPEWLATGKGEMRPREGDVKNSQAGMWLPSQTERLAVPTLGKAMKFAKAYLAARGQDAAIETHPQLVLLAYEIVEAIESSADEADFIEVMGKLAERLRGNGDANDRDAVA